MHRYIYSIGKHLLAAIFWFMVADFSAASNHNQGGFAVKPQNDTICVGAKAEFFAFGTSPRITYRWEFSPKGRSDWQELRESTVGHQVVNHQGGSKLIIPHEGEFLAMNHFRSVLVDVFHNTPLFYSEPVEVAIIGSPVSRFAINALTEEGEVTSYCANSTVFFTDLSNANTSLIANNYLKSWLWDFGDGSVLSRQMGTNLYTDGGTYPVRLTVTDRFGCEAINEKQIRVHAYDVLEIVGPNAVCSNQEVFFQVRSACADCLYEWSVTPGGMVQITTDQEKLLGLRGSSVQDAVQLTVRVVEYNKTLECETGFGETIFLITRKSAPDTSALNLIRKEDILICLSDNPDLLHYRWGYTVRSSGQETPLGITEKNFYDFSGMISSLNQYWVEVRFSDSEACWNRIYLNQ